jgi:hypothetical protein
MKALAVIPTLILSLLVSTVQAGTLDDLESESTKSKSRSSSSSSSSSTTTYSSNSSSNSSSGNSLTNAVGGLLAEIIVKAIGLGITTMAHAGENSLHRYDHNKPETNDQKIKQELRQAINQQEMRKLEEREYQNSLFRAKGDPILPTVRISSQWLYGNDDINAQLYRAEIGYGFFGVSFSQNDLQESGDTLSVSNTLLHYRMSFGNDFSWDLAFGRGKMNGNQKHDGSVFAMPMRYRYNRDWHFEYYPVWSSYEGGSLAEHQFSFNYHYQHIGATLGYKTWSSGATAVDGLFTGLYLSF